MTYVATAFCLRGPSGTCWLTWPEMQRVTYAVPRPQFEVSWSSSTLVGPEGRAFEIDASAKGQARQLIDDVRQSAEAVEKVWRSAPADVWNRSSRDIGGQERRLSELPARRWQA